MIFFFHSCDAFGFIWSVFKSTQIEYEKRFVFTKLWLMDKQKRVRSFDLPWRASCDGSTSWSWLWIAYHSADIDGASHLQRKQFFLFSGILTICQRNSFQFNVLIKIGGITGGANSSIDIIFSLIDIIFEFNVKITWSNLNFQF